MEWKTTYLAFLLTAFLVYQKVVHGEEKSEINYVEHKVEDVCDFFTVAFGAMDCLHHFKGVSEENHQEEQCSAIHNYMGCMEVNFSNCSERDMTVMKINVPWEELKNLKICQQPQLDGSV